MLVVALEGRRPFDPQMLDEVAAVSRRLEGIEGVRRVDSLSTVPIVRLDKSKSLLLTPAISSEGDASPERSEEVAALVRGDRIAPRSLISSDGTVAAINVLLTANATKDLERVVTEIREVSPAKSWISGVPIFRTEINTRTGTEVASFAVATVVIVSALLLGAFSSIRAVFHALSLGAVGTLAVIGTMGWLDVPLTLSTMILPSIMLALGCAYAVHVIAAVVGRGGSRGIEAAVGDIANPLAISSLTTAIGFVAISATRIEALQEVGGFGALGALSLSLASLTLTPALMGWLPVEGAGPEKAVARLDRVAGRLSLVALRAADRHWRAVVLVGLLFCGAMALGLGRLSVETDATRWFKNGTKIRDDYEKIRQRLSGISPMNVVVESNGDPVTSPEMLAAIDGLASHLASLPEVGKVVSIADPLRQLNGEFLGRGSQPLPGSRPLAEQYLLLLSSMDRINDLVTPDHAAANILLRVDNNGSKHLLGVGRAVHAWWVKHGPRGASARATGIMYEFARAQREISLGQLRGLAFAVACIGVILLLAYRSLPVAALALVPNAVPIIAAYGAMGLIGVPLDAGTVLVGSIAFGIAVDDTVHVVDGFRRHFMRRSGAVVALDRTFRRSMAPMALTTIVVGAGFSVLGLSDFTFTRNLGLLTAGIMFLCFLADALLLPALLCGWERLSWQVERASS